MAVITPTPLVMKNCTVTIGTDSYEKAVAKVAFNPTANLLVFKAVAPGAVYSSVETATWDCELSFVQDWTAATSLARYLFDNEGTSVTMLFDPIAGGATITATVVITPGAIGGDVGAYGVATVKLGVVGKPAIGA